MAQHVSVLNSALAGFSPLFPVNPVRSFCCNYDRGKAIRILDTPLMVMRKLELYDNGVNIFLKNIHYFYEISLTS